MMRCPHGLGEPSDCQICLALAWKNFHQAVTSARERLPEGTLPVMLIVVNPMTKEIDLVAPEWLSAQQDQIEFLRVVIQRQRKIRFRRTRLE